MLNIPLSKIPSSKSSSGFVDAVFRELPGRALPPSRFIPIRLVNRDNMGSSTSVSLLRLPSLRGGVLVPDTGLVSFPRGTVANATGWERLSNIPCIIFQN